MYESSSGEVVYVSISTWDTQNDAREFYDAYSKRIELRYEGAEADRPFEAPGRPLVLRNWKTKEGNVTIELSGSRVLVIEGFPATLNRSRLVGALWK